MVSLSLLVLCSAPYFLRPGEAQFFSFLEGPGAGPALASSPSFLHCTFWSSASRQSEIDCFCALASPPWKQKSGLSDRSLASSSTVERSFYDCASLADCARVATPLLCGRAVLWIEASSFYFQSPPRILPRFLSSLKRSRDSRQLAVDGSTIPEESRRANPEGRALSFFSLSLSFTHLLRDSKSLALRSAQFSSGTARRRARWPLTFCLCPSVLHSPSFGLWQILFLPSSVDVYTPFGMASGT